MIRICMWCRSLIRLVGPRWLALWEYCPVCGFEDYEPGIDYDALWVDIGGEGGGA